MRPDQVKPAPAGFLGQQKDGFVAVPRVEPVDHALPVRNGSRAVEAEAVPRSPGAFVLRKPKGGVTMFEICFIILAVYPPFGHPPKK